MRKTLLNSPRCHFQKVGCFLLTLVVLIAGPAFSQALTSIEKVEHSMASEQRQQVLKPLKEVLTELEATYNVHFGFESNIIEDKLVDTDFIGKQEKNNLKKLLNALLSPMNLKYEKLKNNNYVIYLPGEESKKVEKKLLNSLERKDRISPLERLSNQAITVRGQVTSQETGESIPGVNVLVKNASTGTITDIDGNYSISAPEDGTLIFSYIGFISAEVPVNGQSVIDVDLATDVMALQEVVVTGYSSQRKKDIVGSVAVVNTEALKEVPSGSAMQALQGQAAGVDVINNGAPGATSSIFIRGITGFNTAPLVLIDGVQGNINDVPANDVESIQVLKDAGAASIYGARGSNGVIVITTKKGRSGEPSVTYDTYFNFQLPRGSNPLDLLNTQEYASLYSQVNPGTALFPGGVVPDYLWRGPEGRGTGMEGEPQVAPSLYNFDPVDVNNNYIIQKVNKGRTDMFSEVFNPALMQNHTLGVSGATDKASYLLSLGYLDHQGTLLNTYLKRYNIRINTEFNINDNIRIGQNLNVLYKDNSPVEYFPNHPFSSIGDALQWLPFLPVYDIGGNYGGAYAGPGNFELGDWGNPKARRDLSVNDRNRYYGIIGNLYLEIDFLKNFTARTSFGGNVNNFYNQLFEFSPYWRADGGNNTNRLTENSGFYTTAQWTNTLAYKRDLGKHNIAVLVGTESVENKSRNQRAVGEKFFSTDYNYLVLDNAQDRRLPTSSAGEDALFSVFGRLDYSYSDKYLLGVTVRRDGFSAFGPDKKYGVFPSVALGWRVSEENFMASVGWLNDLKIRGSYGVMGNKEGINPANAYTTFGQNPQRSYYDINGAGSSIVQGFFPFQNGNTFTSWERNVMSNIGFDATLFNNRLGLSVEYYKKFTDGLLQPLQTPATAGEAISPFVNIGDIQNTGIDITFNYLVYTSANWQVNIGANFTSYKNIIKSIPAPGYFDESPIRYEEGYPMSSFFGYKVLGVFKDQAEVDAHAVQDGKEPGRYKYMDVDRNDTINTLDRVHFGDPNPDFTMGVNLGVTFKNFDFSAILYTAQGVDIFNNTYQWIGTFARGVGNKSRRLLDAWTPTNTDTNVPKNEAAPSFSTTQVVNSAWMEDGSFIRLRSVRLGYSVPSSVLNTIGIAQLKVYVQGTNLFMITKYSGMDPEMAGGTGFRGVDSGVYPNERGVALGLNLTF